MKRSAIVNAPLNSTATTAQEKEHVGHQFSFILYSYFIFLSGKLNFCGSFYQLKIGFNRDILGVSNIRLLQSLLIVSMIPVFSDKKRKLCKWKIHRAVRTMKFTWCMHDCRALRNSLP